MSSATSIQERALLTNEWPLQKLGGLTLVLSPLLSEIDSLTHAFTTRHGAGSAAPLNWFNLGRHCDDDNARKDAMENRNKLCDALHLDFSRLTVPGQQHTTNIFVLDEKAAPGQMLPNYDAVATDRPTFPLLLHFADCVPVMIYDTKRRALSVIHAGWRGTAGGIVSKAVKVLEEKFGCRPADMAAAVGPAIGRCCYETGADVAEKLAGTVNNGIAALIDQRNGSPFPDLKAINAMQLLEAGVQQIDVTDWCTACHPETFYSHRQSGGQTGRQGAIACIL